MDVTARSPSPASSMLSSRTASSYFPFTLSDSSVSIKETDPYDVPPLNTPPSSPPPKAKGQYCFYTKKKDEAELAHQEEGIRLIQLILHNWLTQPPVPAIASNRVSIIFPVPPEQLYVNSILTTLPFTYSQADPQAPPAVLKHSLSSQRAWRDLAEQVYAELAEARPSLVNGPLQDIARVALIAIHGRLGPRFAHAMWTVTRNRLIDSRLMYQKVGAPKSGRKFDVVISGGGPVGLTTAMLLAHCTATSTSTNAMPDIKIKLYDQRWMFDDPKNPRSIRWRDQEDKSPNVRRRQVITLQDYVVELLDEGFKSALPMGWSDVVWPERAEIGIDTRRGAERVYVNSRQAPIRDVEDRLLREIRDNPMFSSLIELVPERITDETFAKLRGNVDLFVGADGASGRAFTVNYKENDKNIFEREVLEAHQTDMALGIPIQGAPTAKQAQIVFLTLCQTIYLLNSTSNGLGFLNIRLSSDLYNALAAVPATERTFASLLQSDDPLLIRIVALIDAGFRLYGMDISTVFDQRIDVFRLSLASAPKTVRWVAKDSAKGKEGGVFPMVLVGDAAMQHNFWPGRGANSGLLSSWALAASVLRSFEIPSFRGLTDAHVAPFEGFMRSLKIREHDGRGRFIQMIDIERIYAQVFPVTGIPMPTVLTARDSLITRALLWRDRLGTRPEFERMHPVRITDENIISAITRMCGTACSTVTRNSPMAMMDAAIVTLLEGSQQWPTGDMNPLGYDLSPKGFIQPSYEEIGLTLTNTNESASSVRLSIPTSTARSRRRSWSGPPVPAVPVPTPESEFAINTSPAWLGLALLGQKPDIKTSWGDISKSAEKSYKKALRGAYGTRFQKLYDKTWE